MNFFYPHANVNTVQTAYLQMDTPLAPVAELGSSYQPKQL
jgi:hypothetical protein